jgi:effector-binding domain-containing protein
MALHEQADRISWPKSHYLYFEKRGSFQQTAPACWKEFHATLPNFKNQFQVLAVASLYKIAPEMIYRAGIMLKEKPQEIPQGMNYERFAGGAYLRFVLTGSFEQLPEACGRVFEVIKTTNVKTREGFFIENYLNDPAVTPVDQLRTEILVPVL